MRCDAFRQLLIHPGRAPVRTRTMVSTGLTHTLPSPILPVRAGERGTDAL
ncbi:hypothetical protein MAHJHV59_50090 [Mycobacterium avium subsp. hominissuis]